MDVVRKINNNIHTLGKLLITISTVIYEAYTVYIHILVSVDYAIT